jgi:hypothetical protein
MLFRNRLFDEVLGDFGVCAANKHPAYDEAAEDIKHYQESKPLAAVGTAKLGNVPRPALTGSRSQ